MPNGDQGYPEPTLMDLALRATEEIASLRKEIKNLKAENLRLNREKRNLLEAISLKEANGKS